MEEFIFKLTTPSSPLTTIVESKTIFTASTARPFSPVTLGIRSCGTTTNALRVTFAPLCGSGSHGNLADEEIRARASAALNPQFIPHGSGKNRVGERNCIGSQ